jgi:hypothetical protein
LNKINRIITYKIKTSIISLNVFFIIFIVIYYYNENYLLESQEQIIPLAYSQSDCLKSTHIPLTNPIERFQLTNYPFKFMIPPPVARELLNIKIIANPTTQICYNPYTQVYYTGDSSLLTVEITSEILNIETKHMKINPLNVRLNPLIVLIGGQDGILDPLQSPNCPTKAINTDTSFDCSRNKTKLNIIERDQNLILGASKENENGILIISQEPKVRDNDSRPAEIIKTCAQMTPIKYDLPQDTVIGLDCK